MHDRDVPCVFTIDVHGISIFAEGKSKPNYQALSQLKPLGYNMLEASGSICARIITFIQ